jgi:hypothetical protein
MPDALDSWVQTDKGNTPVEELAKKSKGCKNGNPPLEKSATYGCRGELADTSLDSGNGFSRRRTGCRPFTPERPRTLVVPDVMGNEPGLSTFRMEGSGCRHFGMEAPDLWKGPPR